jgi:hypothetical protein
MSSFTIARDGVDPSCVPTRTLYTGAQIPAIGLGTFGSDRFSAKPLPKQLKAPSPSAIDTSTAPRSMATSI